MLFHADVTILGAGIIGLSLALELHTRGARVVLYDPRAAATQASWAAAGMLAVDDPHNPPQLKPLARLSAALYPALLSHIEKLADESIPFQTELTVQHLPEGGTVHLREHSLDPRQLAVGLLSAVQRAGIPLRRPEGAGRLTGKHPGKGTSAHMVVHATGAWAEAPAIFPRKGQMLRVRLPPGTELREVHRSEHAYVVPRTAGPQAGTALIGATVEDAGFNTDTSPQDLAALRQRGAALVEHLPALADARQTPLVEAWAGLRPATADGLPLLGSLREPSGDQPAEFIAVGHFRNGILLAPGTAVLMADLLEGRPPRLDLEPFSPFRFTQKSAGAA